MKNQINNFLAKMEIERLKLYLYYLKVININDIIKKSIAHVFFNDATYCSNYNSIFFFFIVL